MMPPGIVVKTRIARPSASTEPGSIRPGSSDTQSTGTETPFAARSAACWSEPMTASVGDALPAALASTTWFTISGKDAPGVKRMLMLVP
jgi:hypothetical protein